MLMRLTMLVCLMAMLQGCSSRSGLANSSTAQWGDWSPVGSRQISRQKQLALASHYRLYVTTLASRQNPLDVQFSEQLARQLRRYYLQVDEASPVDTLQAALVAANQVGADVVLVAQVQSWPDIDPVRVQECESSNGEKKLSLHPCDAIEKEAQGEMALSIALYDARAGVPIDSISAHSQRGMAAYVYDSTKRELEQLCKMIAGQLSPQAHPL